jgi:Ca-activated chloride channel family protein
MKRSRRSFLTIMGLAIAGSTALYAFRDMGPFSADIRALVGPAPVEVTIASSVTKQKWLEAAAAAFEAEGAKTSDGTPIKIKIKGVLSGESMLQILDGKLQPVVWSPGENTWVAQFQDHWQAKSGGPAMSEPCKPTVYTPMGIAMWRPMAEALGWPSKKIGWKTLIDLAADEQGWASFGHPEWGRFKLGHASPQYSSAGLLFFSSAIYAITGKTKGLDSKEIYAPEVESGLRTLAQNTSKYGMISTDLLNLMARNGPQFLHAASAFEEGVVRVNVERSKDLRWPLVFLFPADGTFWGDHPYCILDGASWVTAAQAEGARAFRDYLTAKKGQSLAVASYLRPLDQSIAIDGSLSLANGTDPAVRLQDVPPLEFPDAKASAAIIDQFLVTKRKATVLLALDISGSMSGESIRAATEATSAFLKRLYPQDRVGLIAFNDQVTTISGIELVSSVSESLSQRVLNLTAGGGTNLYGSICAAKTIIDEARRNDQSAGDSRLYGIVVLSDGADTSGAISENRMFETCLPSGPEVEGIRLFTIAFGAAANIDVLSRMAQVSGGSTFKADADSIDAAYVKISAEQ